MKTFKIIIAKLQYFIGNITVARYQYGKILTNIQRVTNNQF